MNLGVQILTGICLGLVLGFFTISTSINKKEKELKDSYKALKEALDIRYLKLKNILSLFRRHMNEFSGEIDDLEKTIDMALKVDGSISKILAVIGFENSINYKLENIKASMQNYPALLEDEGLESAIVAIAESEVYVGEAISSYNSKNLSYKIFTETFLISFAASILGKNSNIPQFTVSTIEEFEDNYVDEDDI